MSWSGPEGWHGVPKVRASGDDQGVGALDLNPGDGAVWVPGWVGEPRWEEDRYRRKGATQRVHGGLLSGG